MIDLSWVIIGILVLGPLFALGLTQLAVSLSRPSRGRRVMR